MKKDFVCGMNFTSTYCCEVTEYNGIIYYFCSTDCRQKFDSNPDKYISNTVTLNKTAKAEIEWARDPVCRDMIQISDAKAMSLHKGTTYYFCCPICKREFDKNPTAYSDKKEGYFDPDNPNDFISATSRIL